MILVTGGTGFIGPKVVHELRAQEREVRCLVRDPKRAPQLAAWGCELVQGDVTDPASLRAAASGLSPNASRAASTEEWVQPEPCAAPSA